MSSAQQQMSQMLSGYWISQAIYVAAKLGIADLLASRSRTVDDLARETDVQPRNLFRLLRALASVGIFRQEGDGTFATTPLAETLRDDVAGSQRALAIMMGEEHFQAWSNLLHSVRTGGTAFEKSFGMPIFEYLSQHPEQAAIFDKAMTGVHGRETEPMIEAYDFSEISVLADIGGGNGSVLSAILNAHSGLRGILYDLPHVADRTRPAIARMGLVDRCDVIGGSFFESVPPGADAYLLRHIIHDWDDEKSIAILRNCHAAMPADGRLLIIESVIAPGDEPSFGKLLDLTMMVLPGGLERTEAEYRELFAAAGFDLTRLVPTPVDVTVIEGRKA